MAAVTVNRRRSVVFGNKRVILADVSIASNGDTLDTKLKIIDSGSADGGPAAIVNGLSFAAGVVTFVTGGAVTHAQVCIFGN